MCTYLIVKVQMVHVSRIERELKAYKASVLTIELYVLMYRINILTELKTQII